MSRYDLFKNQFSNYVKHPYRPQQVEALDYITQSARPIICLEAPCGMGKSLIAMSYLAMHDGGTYLVQSKSLQHQIRSDFPEAEVMFGRNNFTCVAHPYLTCAECTSSKEHPCNLKSECYYELKKKSVLEAKYRVLNYSYALFESNYVGRFSTPQGVIICDEADTLEGTLGNFVNLHIPASLIKRTNMNIPSIKTAGAKDAIPKWTEWATNLKFRLLNEVGKITQKIREEESKINGKPDTLIQTKNSILSTTGQIDMFVNSVDKNWIMEVKDNNWMKDSGKSVTFKPVWITPELSERYFFRHGNKFILMSATFHPKEVLAKELGRPPGDFDYLAMDSRFDKELRRVYSLGYADLGGKTIDEELPKAHAAVQYILKNGYACGGKEYDTVNTKGIIHTVSWKVNKYLVDNDRTGRIITHDSRNRDEVIERFFEDKGNTVLASPSLTRGLDLKYDLARFVVWLKAPYLHLGDKLTQARCYSKPVGATWYRSVAACEVVQGCGRAMRAEDDWMVGILIDSQIQKLIVDNQRYFAKHFLSSLDIDQGGVDYIGWYENEYNDKGDAAVDDEMFVDENDNDFLF